MHVIVDYGAGNIASILKACNDIEFNVVVSKNPEMIKNADSLILPGVGAFGAAMEQLNNTGLIPLIKEHVSLGKPFLGICLGMQLLYETSYEMGKFQGLGFLKGEVVPFKNTLKVPHMGWNQLTFNKPEHPILSGIKEDDYVYFVHSYYVKTKETDVVAYTPYGVDVPAIVAKNKVVGMQFHPEKSGTVGKALLKAYKERML